MKADRTIPSARLCVLAASLAAALAVPGAQAHEGDHWPVAGKSLKMKTTPDLNGNKMVFKAVKQVTINSVSIAQDPTVSPSSLIVRGTGTFPGTSGVVRLDPAEWSRIGSADNLKGWKYKSGSLSHSAGVQTIQVKVGKKGGLVKIKAKGAHWPFAIDSAQDSIEIVLTLGDFAYCAEYSADRQAEFQANETENIKAKTTLAPTECPQICGNGIVETGEECDDGNDIDADTCTNTCLGCAAEDVEFASTYEGIQQLIFDNPTYNCTNNGCHGDSTQGGLDLRDGTSHAALVNVDSVINPTIKRVFPGDQDLSVLWLKIAEKTLGTVDAPGVSMPTGTSAIVSEDHLEALRLWIRGGAPETGVVAGTAELLGSCLPPATPLDIPQPPVPDPSAGTQFAQPGYNLAANSEVEGCVATYYDVSASVPASMMVDCPGSFPGTNEAGLNAGKCFSFSGNSLFQDAQSHHSIVHIYPGDYDWDDNGWGSWRCYGGPTPDVACDPSTADPCGAGGVCGSEFHNGVACLPTASAGSWGAPDFTVSSAPTFSGSQESTADFGYPNGVYGLLPLKGLIVWNSHAFNLTTEGTDMEAWINIAYTDQRTWPALQLFQNQWIFTQNVPPFEQREYCATHTFAEGTKLFQLSSHTHKRGIRWRYYEPPQTPCNAPGGNTSASCTPGSPGDIFYESYDYSDALTLNPDPPFHYTGSVEDRTIKFCALFDNGQNDPDDVKTQSGSPIPTGNLIIGGPCADNATYCMGGANKGLACNADDNACPGSTCDACYLRGGVTTEDEMFIAIGAYYVDP